MPRTCRLFIPGPCDIEDDVLEAMRSPVQRSYGAAWLQKHHEALSLLKLVFQTKNDIYMVPGPGSACLDMALGSLLAAGEKVIVYSNGFFGARMAHIAERCGLKVVHIDEPDGLPLQPDRLRRTLTAHPDALMVAFAHHETTTAVLNPLKELAALSRAEDRVLLVDAVSSLGGTELPVDQWNIDVCVTASNKCLETPPGLACISVGPRAWQMIDRHECTDRGWYLDLRTWREYAEKWADWNPTPITMPTNIIMALCTSLRKIAKVGLRAHIDKHARACQIVRSGLRERGFELLVPDEFASPTTTAARPLPGFTAPEMIKWLEKEQGICISGAIGKLQGQIFRIGHMGKSTTDEYLAELWAAIDAFLIHKGIAAQHQPRD